MSHSTGAIANDNAGDDADDNAKDNVTSTPCAAKGAIVKNETLNHNSEQSALAPKVLPDAAERHLEGLGGAVDAERVFNYTAAPCANVRVAAALGDRSSDEGDSYRVPQRSRRSRRGKKGKTTSNTPVEHAGVDIEPECLRLV